MKLIKINTETGMFIEDVIVNEFPTIIETQIIDEEEILVEVNDPQYITVPCQGGFYHPRWNGGEWVEGKTQEEIDAILASIVVEPTQEEYLIDLDFRLSMIELGL